MTLTLALLLQPANLVLFYLTGNSIIGYFNFYHVMLWLLSHCTGLLLETRRLSKEQDNNVLFSGKLPISPNQCHAFVSQPSEPLQSRTGPNKCADIPLVLNVLVDHPCDAHGHDGVVPGGDEHQGQTHAHAQEGQRPGGSTRVTGLHSVPVLWLFPYQNNELLFPCQTRSH